MAVDIIWESKRLLWIRYSGTVTADEFIDSQSEACNDGRFDDINQVIVDASGIEKSLADEKIVERMSAMSIAHSKSNPSIRMVVVLDPNEDGQALAGYYQWLSEATGWAIESVKTLVEAREWLSAE